MNVDSSISKSHIFAVSEIDLKVNLYVCTENAITHLVDSSKISGVPSVGVSPVASVQVLNRSVTPRSRLKMNDKVHLLN